MSDIIRIYKDIDLSFSALPGTGDVARKYDLNAVRQAIKTLLLTAKGERKFQYQLGSPLYKMLFEPMDFILANRMEQEIFFLITNFEPRARDLRVNVNPNFDSNGYEVSIFFYVIGLPNPVTYSTFLKRLR